MNALIRLVVVLLISISGSIVSTTVYAYEASHPFRMSSEINAATIEAMGNKHPKKEMESTVNIPAIQARVIESLQADDFSYLYVQGKDSKVWIAGIKVKANVGDTVKYVENVRMDNFFSKTLNRNFKQVIFVSSVSVIN